MIDWPQTILSITALVTAISGFWRAIRRTDNIDRKVDTVKTELTHRVDQVDAAHAQTRAVITRFVEDARLAAAARTRRASDALDTPGIDPPAVVAATAAATTAATAATAA